MKSNINPALQYLEEFIGTGNIIGTKGEIK